MMIQLRQRVNKIANPNAVINDEWITIDNAQSVRFAQRPATTDRKGFEAIRKMFPNTIVNGTVLKEPKECCETESYHYNVISFVDRRTGETQEVAFDTIAFLLNDEGKTIRKIDGTVRK